MIGFDEAGREILHYKKRHPWYPETWATPGDAPHPVVTVGGLRVSIAICFDLHFAAAELAPCDVLLFPSAWVESGDDSRPELLRALGVHVVNANWGPGEPRVPGQGDSCILHASGAVLARGAPRIDAVLDPHG
jgi:predicted amidohydrolase